MRQRLLVNALLVVALLVVIVLLALHVGEKSKPKPLYLTTMTSTHIDDLRFRKGAGSWYVFHKFHGKWWQIAPVKVRANDLMIESLLDGLHEVVARRYPLAHVDLSQLGLKPPRLSLVVGTTSFLFGRTDPVGDYRYIETGGMVDLVHDSLAYRLSQGDARYLSTRLLGARHRRLLTAILLPRFRVLKDPQGEWTIQPRRKVSTARLRRYVQQWIYASALAVTPAGHPKVLGQVELEFRGLPPRRYEIVPDPLGFALVRPRLGLRWEFPRSSRARLFHLPPPSAPRSQHHATDRARTTRG